MMQDVKQICERHNIRAKDINALSGGDINQVFKITSLNDDYVIKLNEALRFREMFKLEAKSLQILEKTESFVIPEVMGYGEHKDKTYLILKYVKSEKGFNFSEEFATSLAKLHKNRSENFGLDFDNYIGRLHQHNLPKQDNSLDFYINLRLEPQFKLARKKGFEFKSLNQFYKTLEQLIPEENASLIHGDLWSGNYLITEKGKACIFDPAIAYAPREMDIAMMKLFGGYPQDIFTIYNDIYSLKDDWKSRIPIWQLYYILVHVNLFGSSYYGQAKHIINQFT
jgi:fructosamine-3-kinase